MNKSIDSLRTKNPLYIYCSEEWFPLIDHYQVISKVKKDSAIFLNGDTVKGIYFILEGKVKVLSDYNNKKERILRLAGDGKLLGHRGFSSKYFPVSCIALCDTTVSFIPLNLFTKLIKTNVSLSMYLINFLSEELRESEEKMKNILHAEIKNRIAYILLYLADTFGYMNPRSNQLAFTLSRKDFSSMAGTTYETVIRTLVWLQNKKLIKLEGKSIYISNLNGLKKLSP